MSIKKNIHFMQKLFGCFIAIIICASINFSQNYLNPEQDVGFDIARTIALNSVLRTEPKTTASVVMTFKEGYSLTLLNRKHTNGWYEVSDINSLKRGWIHGNQIILFYSNGNFHQVTKLKTECAEPIYLSEKYDYGYDLIKAKPNKKQTGERFFRFYPLDYKKGDRLLLISEERELILLSREPIKFTGDESTFLAFKVFWIENGIIGFIDCSLYQRYYTAKQTKESPFVKQRSSDSSASPVTTIHNDSNKTLTLFIDEIEYVILPKSSRTINFSAGRHNYIATAPGVIPSTGSDVWELGHTYNWRFYIVTTTR